MDLCNFHFAGDLQWKTSDLFAENNGLPLGPPAYNPLLGRMELGFDGYMMPSVLMPPYMSYTPGYSLVRFYHQDPFEVGGRGYLTSVFPQRYAY